MSNFREIWQLSVNIGQNWPTFVNTWSVNIWSNSANIDQHFFKKAEQIITFCEFCYSLERCKSAQIL